MMVDVISKKTGKVIVIISRIIEKELTKEPDLCGQIILNFMSGGLTKYEIRSTHKPE